MVNTMVRKIDAHAGVVTRHLLKLSFVKSDPWRPVSNPIPIMMIRDSIGNDTNSTDAVKYTDQYIRVMGTFYKMISWEYRREKLQIMTMYFVLEEDTSGIVGRSADYNGAILICFKDFFDNLAISCISQIVEQKLGSKAARVFRWTAFVHKCWYFAMKN